MKTLKSKLAILSAALLVCGQAGAGWQDSSGSVSLQAPGEPALQTQQEIRDYWTPARMNAAVPAMIWLEGKNEPAGQVSGGEPPGEPGVALSSLTGTDEPTVLLGDDARAVLAITGDLVDQPEPMAFGDGLYPYPPPSNTYSIPETWYGSFPLRAVGKVYFSRSGLNYVCSGAVLGGANGDTLQTAGHCVSNGSGTWSTNVIFKPAHRPAWDAPYGTWFYRQLLTTVGWHNSNNYCLDYGFIILAKNSGLSISNVTGHFGYAYNQSRTQHWAILGYPAANGWGGNNMVLSDSSWNRNDSPSGCSPFTMGTGWGQAGGSSGGPWVISYKPQQAGANNYINSVNSYGYIVPDQPAQIYGPYFDSAWKSNYDAAGAL